ncbi:MAG: hypothetical protein WD904_00770 [Dehalococcoidia bacterium]
MDEVAVTNPPATKPDELRKARAERYEAIKVKIEDLDKACAETRKIIYDLRRLLRQ